MKKILLLSLLFACTFISQAQTSDKKWGFGVGAGVYGTSDEKIKGFIPELYFSRYVFNFLDLNLTNNIGLTNSQVNGNIDIVSSFLNFRFRLPDNSKKYWPFLYAGPGFLANNSTKGMTFDVGLGGKYYIEPTTALYLEAGYINGIESTTEGKTSTENLWKATVGLEFDFGKAKDSDMDGVSDKKDKCPNTPTGVAVDANGCPIDSDADGVADYIDECPTVAGLTSLKGCPDKDKDGVADKDDACPDVAGVISLKGCPDSDGDGIADKDDKCPNTPKGYRVDASGCPFDRDKDGVVDEEDECPTVTGPKENKGCPVKEPEKKEITAEQVIIQNIKVIPVHFVSNHSYLTDYSKGQLDKLIQTLNSDKAFKVNIFGYADAQGTDEYNVKLSQSRIESVISYLEEKGIATARIIHQKAFGKANPVASNNTEEGRLKNRRVEFEIFKMK
jgi:outer membrane protein OmpA-like peptidoglycan-associated protein